MTKIAEPSTPDKRKPGLATRKINAFRALQLRPNAPLDLISEAYWALMSQAKQNEPRLPSATQEALISGLNSAYELLAGPQSTDEQNGTGRHRATAVRRRGILELRPKPEILKLNHYELLCVGTDAEIAVIRVAAVFNSRRFGGHSREAVALRNQAAEAERVLCDPILRAKYDASLGLSHDAAAEEGADDTIVPGEAPGAAEANDSGVLTAFALDLSAVARAASRRGRHILSSKRSSATTANVTPPVDRALAPAGLVGKPFINPEKSRVAVGPNPKTPAAVPPSSLAVPVDLPIDRLLSLRGDERSSQWAETSAATVQAAPGRPAFNGNGAIDLPAERVRAASTPELEFTAGPLVGRRLHIGADSITLGTGESADVVLSDKDGVIEPAHARIWLHGEDVIFRNLGPGLTLIGNAVLEVPLVKLDDGDQIQIGQHHLRFTRRI